MVGHGLPRRRWAGALALVRSINARRACAEIRFAKVNGRLRLLIGDLAALVRALHAVGMTSEEPPVESTSRSLLGTGSHGRKP